MDTKPTTKLIDALTVRTKFGEIMETVEKEQVRYVVSRRGKAKIVLMSIRDYLQNIVKKPDVLVQLQMDAKKAGKDTISDKEIDAEIRAYRKSKKS
ncbi:MAG: type II toxin-antitoxin system Phd/YefM family antitoxin [Syntrophales bacterium]|nr:type II toxin-antitoxin system Phd/YefM family antitoxin [Syntrophales bacterium]